MLCIYIFILNFIILLTDLTTSIKLYSYDKLKNENICTDINSKRVFLELGDQGELHANNFILSSRETIDNVSADAIPSKNYTKEHFEKCNLELVTCPECVIKIILTFANFSAACTDTTGDHFISNTFCPCEYLTVLEPPYDFDLSGKYLCNTSDSFLSKTRSVLMKLYFKPSKSHIFTLKYFSQRNVNIVKGSPKENNVSYKAFSSLISTPFFPLAYPRDCVSEHILICECEDCRIHVDFTDFQIGILSSVMVFDTNGQILGLFKGDVFRPGSIKSTGKSLLIQFRGNGATGIGYKAEVSFLTESESLEKNTDCGGIVESIGGAITMMNMINDDFTEKYYDCIWIIKPLNNYMILKTHISLKVETFSKMESKSTLEIREGTTSTGPLLDYIHEPLFTKSETSHVTQISSGFYIRLKGYFLKDSQLTLIYSVFNYMNCYIGSEFLCKNNRCLSIKLHCDGLDHCGDGSDETESCKHFTNFRSEHFIVNSLKPNYYFPKTEQIPDLRAATGIFVISTLGILVVLSGWMMILYRMGVRARRQRELHSQLQTISELLDRERSLEEQPDNPPDYEAPPEYEEVIKIGLENEIILDQNIKCMKKSIIKNKTNHQNTENFQFCEKCRQNSKEERKQEQIQQVANHAMKSTKTIDFRLQKLQKRLRHKKKMKTKKSRSRPINHERQS